MEKHLVGWRTFRRKNSAIEWTDSRNIKGILTDVPKNCCKLATVNFCNEIGEENIISIDVYQLSTKSPVERTVWFVYKE